MITRLLHVSLPVHDLVRARQFYEQVLGLSKSPLRPKLGFDGVWYEIGEQQIHLLASADTSAPQTNPLSGRERHVALAIADLDQAIKVLQRYGIDFRLSAAGRRALFCRDPDGNTLELAELK